MDRFITPQSVMRYRFSENPVPQWETAVICFRDDRGSKTLVTTLNARPLGYKVLYGMEEFPGASFVYQAEMAGKTVGVITRCNWGGPQAAIVVEELAALGVKRVIGYGAAGSFHEQVPRGTQVWVTRALLSDGTSQSYLAGVGAVNASESVAQRLQALAATLGISLANVCAASVDALYRETNAAVAQWHQAGAEVVTMESGAFYAAAEVLGLDHIWLGFVSDYLGPLGWQEWHGRLDAMEHITANLILELMRQELN
jgi:uridine phosphorylase